MKNTTLLLSGLLVLMLLFSCATSNDETFKDWRLKEFAILDGEENMIQSISIQYNDENRLSLVVTKSADGTVINTKSLTYSETGKLTLLENTSGENSIVRSQYNFDQNDFLISVITTDKEGTELATVQYTNDDQGNPLEWESHYGKGSQPIKFEAEYDRENRVIKTVELDPEGNPIYYSTNDYNEMGLETAYSIYSPEGILDQKLENIYEGSSLSKSLIIDTDGNILYSTIYEMDENGRAVKVSNFNQYDDLMDYNEMAYDDKGNEIENISFNHDGHVIEKTVSQFDAENNRVAVMIYSADDELITVSRSLYENEPLHMSEEEFNSLVFQVR